MSLKRITALMLSLILSLTALPFAAFAESGVAFELSCSIADGEKPKLGDNITYTVALTENTGFVVGTLYFKVSDNLEYVSSTLMGEDKDADQALTGENQGSWGLVVLGFAEDYKETSEKFCTMTFKVCGIGDISVEFYTYGLVNSAANPVDARVTPSSPLAHTVAEPEKPVILTDKLSDAVLGHNYFSALVADRDDYLSWELASGELPEGLELSNDGTISGTPSKFGEFKFGVRASVSVAEGISSEIAELTLTVLEKPKKVELTDASGYKITDDGYIRNLVIETKLSDFLDNFENKDFLKVFDGKGNPVDDPDDFIGTGYTVKLMNGDEAVHSLEVVVIGDTTGDGKFSSTDYQRIRAHLVGTYDGLVGAYFEAAHVSGNEKLSSIDYQRLRAHFLGNYNIYQ